MSECKAQQSKTIPKAHKAKHPEQDPNSLCADVDRTLDRIISGVFHHPALREHGRDGAADIRGIMFATVESWWGEKDDEQRDILRDQLSRDGVQEGRNHKDGVQDCGHGCGKPLALPKNGGGSSQNASSSAIEGIASEAVGGGALGGILGGIVGGMGSMLLNNNSKSDRESPEPQPQHYGSGNDYQSRPHESQQYGDSYSQVQPAYGYQGESSYGAPVHREEYRPTPGGYEYQSETTYGQPARRDEYSGYAPPVENYQRQEYHSESQGYYQEERRETYQSGHSEYRTEERVEYGGAPPMGGYGGGHGGGYGGPPPPREYGYGEPPAPRGYEE